MKRTILLLGAILCSMFMRAQTVTYPVSNILSGESLEDVHTKLTANSNLDITGDGTIVTVSGSSMYLDYDDLYLIATNGGTINNYQLVIKAPVAFADVNVHTNLPNRLNALGNVLTYENYFQAGNVKVDGGFMYAITMNYAGIVLSGTQATNVANQARLLYGGSNSDYILLVSDTEFTDLF